MLIMHIRWPNQAELADMSDDEYEALESEIAAALYAIKRGYAPGTLPSREERLARLRAMDHSPSFDIT